MVSMAPQAIMETTALQATMETTALQATMETPVGRIVLQATIVENQTTETMARTVPMVESMDSTEEITPIIIHHHQTME